MKLVFRYFLILTFIFLNESVYAQALLTIKDSSTGIQYHIKKGKTVAIQPKVNKDKWVKDKIVSFDSTGIVFKKFGKVNYEKIESINFRPFSKNLRTFNIVYYSFTINLAVASIFVTFYGYGSNEFPAPLVLTIVTLPVWAVLIPAVVNFYYSYPKVTITHIDKSSFIK